jgi:translation elongation factor EF-Tu-like GTPase
MRDGLNPSYAELFDRLPPPDVEAEITFLAPEDGGKALSTRSGYRAQVSYDGADWCALFRFATDDWVRPGATTRARMWFISPEAQRGRLRPGTTFEVREGAHTVGRGHITMLVALSDC